jgi:pimeloyl-ACP methyl ester carboxylesterase
MLRKAVHFPIHPAGLPNEQWEITGWLTIPPNCVTDTLLILVHGACYTHFYWDMPYQPEIYSCVIAAYESGIPTLNIDRLGNGESSHPPGKILDLPRNAEALHQIIVQIKDSGIEGHRFSHYIPVGHSLGSLTSALMQATYGSADALVLTGLLPCVNQPYLDDSPESNAELRSRFKPIAEDSVFSGRTQRYDLGYFTLPSEARIPLFFRVPPADPKLIKLDETLKGTFTLGEMETTGAAANSAIRIGSPVLVQIGQYDAAIYDPSRDPDMSRLRREGMSKAPANFTFAELVPGIGHNLTQHPNARESYSVMFSWIESTLR